MGRLYSLTLVSMVLMLMVLNPIAAIVVLTMTGICSVSWLLVSLAPDDEGGESSE